MWEHGSHCYGNKRYADRKEAYTGNRLKQEQHRRDSTVVIDRSTALTEVKKKYLVQLFFFFSSQVTRVQLISPHVQRGGRESCCNKWQHRRREITVQQLIGGEPPAPELGAGACAGERGVRVGGEGFGGSSSPPS